MVVLKWKNKTILFSPTAIGFVSWKRSSRIRHTFMAACLPHNKFFSPIWANWACFARGRTARHPFFKLLSQHTSLRDLIKDTPLVKIERRRKKSPPPGGIQTHDVHLTRRVLSSCVTAVALSLVTLRVRISFAILHARAKRKMNGDSCCCLNKRMIGWSFPWKWKYWKPDLFSNLKILIY